MSEELKAMISFYDFLSWCKDQGDASVLNYTGFYLFMQEYHELIGEDTRKTIVGKMNCVSIYTRANLLFNTANLTGVNFSIETLLYKRKMVIKKNMERLGLCVQTITNEYGACSILTKI